MRSRVELYGRRTIYTRETEITRDNVADVLQKANSAFLVNQAQIQYLYNYYKGKQPILQRVKEIRPEICARIVENRALEIVDFKTAYICGEPILYIASNDDENICNAVSTLNSFMRMESKASLDKELFDWQHICGTSYRMVLPGDTEDGDAAPFRMYTLDPRQTFMIYSASVDHRRMAAVMVQKDANGVTFYSVFTNDSYFEVQNGEVIYERSPDTQTIELERATSGGDVDYSRLVPLGIPIFEYPANMARMGAFECVLCLLDAINELDSNRADGVAQFIQSLIVLYNCQLPDGTDANTIREKGIIELSSVNDNKADIKILSEQLNQEQTQTLKDDMYRSVLTIVGMPSQSDGSTSDSSNNGAVIMRNGWTQAESRAKDSEAMFKKSEREMLRYLLKYLRQAGELELRLVDVDYRFTRRQYDALLTKVQALAELLNTQKVAPRLAFNVCGLFVDPEEAARESADYVASLAEKENQTVIEDETDDEPVEAEGIEVV